MKKTLISLATTAALASFALPVSAVVFNDFQVDPNYDSNTVNAITADKITGNYTESIIFDGLGGFDVRLRWEAGQFVMNDGTTAIPAFTSGLGSAYQLYALYEGEGTYSTSGGVTTFVTTAGTGFLRLYLDPLSDGVTAFTNSAPGVDYTNIFDLTNAGGDFLVANGTPADGSGKLDPSTCASGGINCGSFGTSTSISLTAFGKTFFIDPVPFYNLSFQSGQLNNFDVSGEQLINGSMDVVFDVPEPLSLSLVGLGLISLGMSRRRKS